MLPTLNGRIQTRIFLLLTVGVIVTLLITPVLPGVDDLGAGYGVTFRVLATVLVLGIGWEFLYHFLQAFRWEKDWPTFFGLITAINEGVLAYLLVRLGAVPGLLDVPVTAFLVHFLTVWLLVWLVANGPMRVPFLRWRFRGGRLV